MQHFATCLNIAVPVFALVFLGYLLKQKSIISSAFVETGCRLLFGVALPVSLFRNIYESDFSETSNLKFVGFILGSTLVLAAVLFIGIPLIVKDRGKIGVIVQAGFRSNILIMGIPLARNMFGEAGLGPISIAIAYVVPLYNVLAVVALSVFSEDKSQKIKWGPILLKIVKNPLIIASVAAVPFALLHIELPVIITRTMSDIASFATPFGLLLLGGQMQFPSMRKNVGYILIAVVFKLVFTPIAMMSAALMFMGFNRYELGAVFIVASAPCAISSFIMAKTMTKEGELAGQIVFLTTFTSIFTTIAGLYWLSQAGVL